MESADRPRRPSRLRCPVPIRIVTRNKLDALAVQVAAGASFLVDDVLAGVAAIIWRDACRLVASFHVDQHLEDVFQEGYAHAGLIAVQYTRERGAALTFFSVAARNQMMKKVTALRREQNRERHLNGAGDVLVDLRPSGARSAISAIGVEELLSMLPTQQRYVLWARYIEGRSNREIQRALGVDPSWVNKLISKAKQALQRRHFRKVLRGQG